MEQYDDIVVGAGVSGLTVSLLLGMSGRKVLLLEKSPAIGGSLKRFYKQGVPFDTGFHFTGGFNENGTLQNMLKVLGISNKIRPIYLNGKGANKFVLEASRETYEVPFGYNDTIAWLKKCFPAEHKAIDDYFALVTKVCRQTLAMDIRNIALSPEPVEEDFITLQEVLDNLTADKKLQTLLSAYDMCYGTCPKEVSFAAHARVCYSLHESIARVRGGGETFISAFKEKFNDLNITIKCETFITQVSSMKGDYAEKFILNNGETVTAQNCIFTIHPKQILEILPREHLTKAFINRVEGFEEAMGFFCVFAQIENPAPQDFELTIVSLFPVNDLNLLLAPGNCGEPALTIMKSREELLGKSYCVLNALEVSFFEDVKSWQNSKVNSRGEKYLEYKRAHAQNILRRVEKFYPQYQNRLKVMDVSSQLTFRDYLNSPQGSAYGVKQSQGQFNLFGKLPIRNCYAAGQSAVLPGIVGSMLSSFMVARSVIGKDAFSEFVQARLAV